MQDEYKLKTRYPAYDLLPLIRQHALSLMSLHNQNTAYQIYWILDNEIICLENSSEQNPILSDTDLIQRIKHAQSMGGYWIESTNNHRRYLHSVFEDKNTQGCWFLRFAVCEIQHPTEPILLNKSRPALKDILHQKLDIVLEKIDQEESIGHTRRNREIVRRSFAMGIFNMKGAVSIVSNRLNISQHTVYLYVRECKQVEASVAKVLEERNA